MSNSYKEQLSIHVEEIFKTYASPGLHICDIATGGGKSYTIGKLTCEFYPQHFDRIIILCVQNKLVDGMEREIDRFIDTPSSLIKKEEKLLIQNNGDVIKKAIENDSFKELLEQMRYQMNEIDPENASKDLRNSYNKVNKSFEVVKNLIQAQVGNADIFLTQIAEAESYLRANVRNFFEAYKRGYIRLKKTNSLTVSQVIKKFPALIKAYPQADYKSKKVLLMTVHKAMYGIDPIISEKISIQDFAEKNKRTLILFDESDQAALAMRNAIFDQEIEKSGGAKRFSKGYNGYLQYKQLIDMSEYVSNEYHGNLLGESLKTACQITSENWKRIFGTTEPYKNIFLGDIEEMENYRRGVFFSGPAMKINVSKRNDKLKSYICYRKSEKHFKLHHAEDPESLTKQYDYVVPMDKFLSMTISNTTAIKAQLSKVVNESLQKSKEAFDRINEDLSGNKLPKNHYLGYPSRDREIHTLISRFETTSEYQFKQQLTEFMTNRKNLIIKKGEEEIKVPDYSVYSQGVQLYQEEIDEMDNQHRVRLSSREITTTPEKILLDLLRSEGTSLVLCSATASCASVISNFDIQYLKNSFSGHFNILSEQARNEFDRLVALTYPQEHKIEVKPIQRHTYEDPREDKMVLPDYYKQMFSKDAQEEGLADKWFKCTKRILTKNKRKDQEDISYHLSRLFQFIEAYSWFIKNDSVRSMIFFQNRIGDPIQTSVLSCLIDGSYKNQNSAFDDDLPRDWNNEHIETTKDWDEVEGKILKKLSENKDSKIMLVSAYASFKAGANMQYEVPDGLDFIQGDNWQVPGQKLKKDWDAIYVQCPSAYLMMAEDGNEQTFEKSLYNAMLSLMMLYERGCLSRNEVALWLNKALSNAFWFGDKNNPGITNDKAAWAQTMVEQAVGRLCRTRNKPHTTYILYDCDMEKYFMESHLQKSLTKEFKALADYILSIPKEESDTASPEEIKRCNDANNAHRMLQRMRTLALRYTPHPNDDNDFDDDMADSTSVPHNVRINQIMNQSYKQTIISKPVIQDFCQLSDDDKHLSFISKCYGDWSRNENNEYYFSYDKKHHNEICPDGQGERYKYPISPSSVRLDVLMKNDVIRQYFETKGYATTWGPGALILHPEILMTDYAGEIGEEAFKAIILQYTNCKEEDFVHLEGRDYELADFVLCNPDGSYKIAFDVKNMNPRVNHDDKSSDMPTTDKRKIKRERLNCNLITVNMLKLTDQPMGDSTEIHGVIDEEGNIIPSAIQQLKTLIG